MADLPSIFWDDDGYAHTDCLYWEGFPRILWDTLRIFHYPEPPRYKGRQFSEDGVQKCSATMTIPQHPTLTWPPIEIEVVGYRLVDAFETALSKLLPPSMSPIQMKWTLILLAYFRQSMLATKSGSSGPPTLVI